MAVAASSRYWRVALIALCMLAGCGRIGVALLDPNGGGAGGRPMTRPDAGDSGLDHDAGDAGPDLDAGDGGPDSDAGDGGRDSDAGDGGPDTDAGDAGGGDGGGSGGGGDASTDACVDDVCSSCVNPQPTDSTCDGVDDDCDGANDEDYVPSASACGDGVCASSGMRTCSGGSLVDSCTPGTPSRSNDPAPANGLDDDCDGEVDEDACDTTPLLRGPGAYDLTVPGGCRQVTVQLWGGGGASGKKSVPWSSGSSGRGGAGGYASSTLTISGALALYVGNGGASGCNAGGTNPGSASYAGGSGGTNEGAAGGDGMVTGGGNGAMVSPGKVGGRGHYGGGGGGQGDQGQPFFPAGGSGGGGGAASVLRMNGMLEVVAGGGGGSGGEAGGWYGTSEAGSGGDGCSDNGGVGSLAGCGGGGGGGVCLGTVRQPGTDGVPFPHASLPGGQAVGATADCAAGGGGYAIVTFSR